MSERLSPQREAEIADLSPAVAAMTRYAETTGPVTSDEGRALYRIATDLYAELNQSRTELAAVRAERGELKQRVARAIYALKSPAPQGSEHYRSGWDDGLEASIDAARTALDEAGDR